jgi:hypothetical protein
MIRIKLRQRVSLALGHSHLGFGAVGCRYIVKLILKLLCRCKIKTRGSPLSAGKSRKKAIVQKLHEVAKESHRTKTT